MGPLCKTCKNHGKRCYCAPNSTCGDYDPVEDEKCYTITFVQNHVYTVIAGNEEDAIDLAERLFRQDMTRSAAKTWYDEVVAEVDN